MRVAWPAACARLEVPPDQLDVLARRPAELLEACLQRVQGRRNVIGPDVHQTDALDGLAGRVLASEPAAGEKAAEQDNGADAQSGDARKEHVTMLTSPTYDAKARRAYPGRFLLCRGAGTPLGGGCAHAERSISAARAVATHLLRELANADRLLEVAGESGGEEPLAVAFEWHRAQRDDRDSCRLRPVRERSRGICAMHVGKPQIHQNHVWQMLVCERDPSAPLSASSVRKPAARSRSRASFRFFRLSSTIRTSGAWRGVTGVSSVYATIRLVLAEDHYLVREGVRRLLETHPDLEVAAVCGDLDSLLAAVDAERPDVVVTDIRMPPGDADEGIQAAERLRETNPEVGVVVLSQYANPGYVLALLEGGSARRAYLLKERVEDLEQLVAAIRTVADGGSVIDPKVVEALVAENARGEESPLGQLTPRERDVLREMAEGKNNAAIADALFLTERSVEKVIHSIFLKLGLTWETAVHKRVKAVILYLAESG